MDDFGGDDMDLVKLISGVFSKFLLTMYFPISYTYIGQVFSIYLIRNDRLSPDIEQTSVIPYNLYLYMNIVENFK